MIGDNLFTGAEVGSVMVHTTNNRGHTPEELAEMALDKIIYIGEDVPEPLRDQALAYKERLRAVLIFYMQQAIKSERTTIRAEIRAEMTEK